VRQVSLRLTLLLVAVVAVGMAGYRQWRRYHTIVTAVYAVDDLVPADPPGADAFQPLMDEVAATVQPGSWQAHGGDGTMIPFMLNRSLLVRNNVAAHEQVRAFLGRKRAASGTRPVREPGPTSSRVAGGTP
jgi:hypothetical protein